MLLIIIRLAYMVGVVGAALTASPTYVFIGIIPALIIFLKEGAPGLLFWGVVGASPLLVIGAFNYLLSR